MKENNLLYANVSGKTGDGIKACFRTLATEIFESYLQTYYGMSTTQYEK